MDGQKTRVSLVTSPCGFTPEIYWVCGSSKCDGGAEHLLFYANPNKTPTSEPIFLDKVGKLEPLQDFIVVCGTMIGDIYKHF